jgi:hypothetical protein
MPFFKTLWPMDKDTEAALLYFPMVLEMRNRLRDRWLEVLIRGCADIVASGCKGELDIDKDITEDTLTQFAALVPAVDLAPRELAKACWFMKISDFKVDQQEPPVHFAQPLLWSFSVLWAKAQKATYDSEQGKLEAHYRQLQIMSNDMVAYDFWQLWSPKVQSFFQTCADMSTEACSKLGTLFSDSMSKCVRELKNIDVRRILAEDIEVTSEEALKVLKSPPVGALHAEVSKLRPLRAQSACMNDFLNGHVMPLLAKFPGANSAELQEQLSIVSAANESLVQNSGQEVGRALGNLSALQVLFSTDAEKRSSLSSRLVFSLTSPPSKNVTLSPCAKMTGDDKLLSLLRAAAKSDATSSGGQ